MGEERRSIKGYEELYVITISGRIISKRNNRVRPRKGDEYGYANVHLSKNGTRELFKTFKLWEAAFPEVDKICYKGKR